MSLIKVEQLPTTTKRFGLENYGKSRFPNTSSVYEIPFWNGRYNLGMTEEQENEFSMFFIGKDSKSREWQEFLSEYTLKLDFEGPVFDSSTMKGKFDYHVYVKANPQLCAIASSKGAVNDVIADFKYVVVNEVEDEEKEYSTMKLRNSALSELNKLEKNDKMLLLYARYIFPVRNLTSPMRAYTLLDVYLKESRENVERFLAILKEPRDLIDVVVTFKLGYEKNIIRKNRENYFYNHASGTVLGKNQDECVEFLSNPKNQDELGTGSKSDSSLSIKSQLQGKE